VAQDAPRSQHYDTTDWGESDVEEMLETLDMIWHDRIAAAALGSRAARFMAGMRWTNQLDLLLRAIKSFI
jgi:hypothetical protein